MRYLFLLLTTVLLSACGADSSSSATSDSNATITNDTISGLRLSPKTAPVANYEKRVKDDLNEWYFRVKLYETEKRFVYRMVMEYETISEEKNITFPNLNEEPKPDIRPGSREYDAIVGFDDNKGAFKEYINVFVEDDNLRIRTLKHYAVYEKEVE